MADPIVGGIIQGAGALGGGLMDLFGPDAQNQKWGTDQIKQLYEYIKTQQTRGSVIGSQKMSSLMAMFQEKMKPLFSKLTAGGARMGSLSSPDILKMLSGQMIAPTAEFAGNLEQQNVNLTEQRNMQYLQMLANLSSQMAVGGGR